jgi:hypothetical protein
MALADNFMFTPIANSGSNNSIKEEFGNNPDARLNTRSDASMNVGAGFRVNSNRLDSDRSTEGLAAFLAGGYTGRVDGFNESYNALDRLRPETKEVSAGMSVPVGRGSLELSRDIRELPAYGVSTNNNNVTYNHNNGHYIGGYFGDDGYKGAYAGYQINPNTSVSGNVNLDPDNKVSYALMQLRHTY